MKHVAIMGATGAVGQELLALLESRDFPLASLKLLASARSAGSTMTFRGQSLPVETLTADSFAGMDLVLASAGGSISKEFAPHAVAAGAVVVDNTSYFRMAPDVPLVIPEINPEAIWQHHGIIANPNCSTIIMLLPLWPIHQAVGIKRIIAATYQAASGAGAKAMAELEQQTRQVLAGEPAAPVVFPHPIAFNLFSHNSTIGADGYCDEESKMIRETHKIFGDDSIKISATTVRVPIPRAHSEALHIELNSPLSVDDARELLRRAPGVTLVDDRETNTFPMPLTASGQDDVLVGRIRLDHAFEPGLALFVSGDQIRKGAALNAVQIAELLVAGRQGK